ncbi:MAG: glycoside hydrolase family 32 protein [Planctomycetota bacterium]|nr:glycoside hydrolase family 32 protein [Planctomycetota bacterium]
MKHALTALALLLCAAAPSCAGEDDILIADFEGDTYGEWKTTGEAFGPGPARGTLPNQMEVTGFLGKGLVNSFHKGDGTTGTLTSPPFKIERKFINFLIGGGGYLDETYIALLADGKAVRTATGPNTQPGGSEELAWHSWDVTDLAGKEAVIQIVDKRTGGWGHINVDHILQSTTKKQTPEEEINVAELYNETYRPQFHFTARKNWLNDPNGLVFYKGEYHLFFQHNPTGIDWGNMTWGHAVSPDLIHWEQLRNAIEPDKLGTIFSGSAVVDWNNTTGFQKGDEKTIVAIYTAAGNPFTQCIAYSNDCGRTFAKYDKNPVLPHIVGGNRDPKVVWYAPGKVWVMALFKDKDIFAFFSSPDLKTWTQLQDMAVPGCGECPDFFEMPVDGDKNNRKWVWTAANGHYLIGTFDGKTFTKESGPHVADHGKNYYAVQTYSDIPEEDGRRIQIAWMNGGKYPRMPFNQQMSFPCEMKLRTLPEGLRICRTPVKEIEALRAKEHKWNDATLKPGDNPLADISGDLFDVRAEFELGDATEFGFRARGQAVTYSVKDKKLSCLGRSAELAPIANRIKLQILLDRTTIEAFGNDGKVSMTSCFVPKVKDKSMEAFAVGGSVKIVSLSVYELKSAWRK